MKSKVLMFVFACLLAVDVYAWPSLPGSAVPVPFIIKKIDPVRPGKPIGRSPIAIPEVYIDGNVLYFDSVAYNATLLLVQDDVVVYEAEVSACTPQVTLPNSIEGECELRLIVGDWMFVGEIEL